MADPESHCPNCGAALNPLIAVSKMVDCTSCGTTVFRDAGGLRLGGARGEMLDAPALLRLGEPVRISGHALTPVGQLRFDYGEGWWDEFWCQTVPGGPNVWVSVDEGDLALERPVSGRDAPRPPATLALGTPVEIDGTSFVLTETDRATCIAFRGALPEEIALGEVHDYANFSDSTGRLLSFERWPGGHAWFLGEWLDPWTLETPGGAG